ncbi:MAG: insulinase family protein [Pseudomonadota bacterium]|nr:insulinase family protein [Pseudomonadota bacterium]
MSNSVRRLTLLLAGTSLLAACATAPRTAPMVVADAPPAAVLAPPVSNEPVPVSTLVSQVAIPHETFRLANGLTVLVHEDRKAPVVGVSMWYNVGSKDEPRGKTGFAHLFEHLMFNGSENLPGDFFTYLQQIGATDYNGTTSFDRTNYFQTVPSGAIDRALFMESDRMGYLLGAVTQGTLDNQRGVVQNEKRSGDNRPGGLVFEQVLKNLFPEGHPYRHSAIGSMADLDAASLADTRNWFRDKYGPNNAVLVLAGDIDAATAWPFVEKYFAAIPRGPVNTPAQAAIPTLSAPKSLVMQDRVATTTVSRYWTVPGLLDRQLVALDVGGSVLGGLASSRFDKVLVRDEQLAVSASASMYALQRLGIFYVEATVKPGVEPALVEKRLDELVAELIAEGPTEAEVQRAALNEVGGRIRGLEQVGGFGGKAVTLAEGQTFTGDSEFYKKNLATYASITPAEVQAAMRQWLTRPALSVKLEPGERPPYVETKFTPDGKIPASRTAAPRGPERPVPAVGQLTALDFPDITHTRLANGIEVDYAHRNAVPVTQLALSFDAGDAADPASARGLQSLMFGMLDEGTETLDAQAFSEAKEQLGVDIGASSSLDRSTVIMSALSANLAPSLALVGDMVKAPAFAPAALARVKNQSLTAISQLQKDPNGIAARALPALLYGAGHPYAALRGGDASAITSATREDLLTFKDRWIRADNVKIFVVSDRPLAEILPMIDAQFGSWQAPAVAKGVKAFGAAPPRPAASRIVLIDRPGSPQSVISGGQLTTLQPKADLLDVGSGNFVLGGDFLSRMNMDLRESKGWSYGVGGSIAIRENSVPYIINAPVQTDRTADSIAALDAQIGDFLGSRGITADELTRATTNSINELPGQFETSRAVLSAMMSNDLLDRPDNYYETLAGRYRAQTRASVDSAIRGAVARTGFVWVVVGDAAKVRPQLAKLGMPVEVIEPR